MSLDLGSCAQSADFVLGMYFDGTAALRPVGGQFYVHDAHYLDTFYVYGTSGGPLGSRVTAETGYDARDGFWFTEDGERFVAGSGEVYDADPVSSPTSYLTQSLTRLGALGNPGVYEPRQLVLHADHSSVRESISVIPLNDYLETTSDTVLKRYTALDSSPSSYPAAGTATALPSIAVNGALYAPHGRYVFYRSDGSARYAVIRTAPGAAASLFAVAAMGP
jgi:hypothetical protein